VTVLFDGRGVIPAMEAFCLVYLLIDLGLVSQPFAFVCQHLAAACHPARDAREVPPDG